MTEQTVVPIVTTGRRLGYLAAALIPLALGVTVLVALVTGNVAADERVLLGICSVAAVLLGLGLAAAAVKVLPRRDLLIGPQGIGMVHRRADRSSAPGTSSNRCGRHMPGGPRTGPTSRPGGSICTSFRPIRTSAVAVPT